MSRAITEKQEDRGPGRGWGGPVEMAPSVVREDEPSLARAIGLMGASFVIFGGLALMLNLIGKTERVGIGLATFILAVGVMGLLAHAAYDRDLQVRRVYWGLGGVGLFFVGVMLCLIPFDGRVGGLFSVGYPCLVLSLLFFLATLHHETDSAIRRLTLLGMLGVGGVGVAIAAVFGNNFTGEFLVPYGTLLAVLGLGYLVAFISQTGIANDWGYRVALAVGGVGLAFILLGVIRSLFKTGYLVPDGLMFVSLGLLYVAVAFGIVSDSTLIVLTRREISSFFFSPLIYLVLIGFTGVAWLSYNELAGIVVRRVLPEPIVRFYLFGLWPVLTVTFLVPVLTMKLLSEEKRAGSLELLLTAPVNESTIVLGKFLAAFLLYMLMWAPWWLLLVALRIGGGVEFEYRSLFTFILVQAITGAGFVAMGLFFSSLTRNQVASAVLTFAGMMAFLGVYLLRNNQATQSSRLLPVLLHMDYVELWLRATDGIVSLKFLLFHASAAILWLFLTVKVLEARRWA